MSSDPGRRTPRRAREGPRARTVGIIGLGKIGLPVAIKLLERNFTVVGYRRTVLEEFVALGGLPARSSAEVARRSDVVITALPNGSAMLDAVAGPDGVLRGAHPGLTVIDTGMHALDDKESARDALDRVGVPMLDCPISGLPPQVLARRAVVFASGDSATFDACAPVLDGFSDNVFYVGGFGAGIGMKCVANLLVAIHVLATAEAMTLADRIGLDAEAVVRVLGPSVASSAQFNARAPMMAAHRYEPPLSTVEQLHECVVIIDALAAKSGSPTPLLDAAHRYYDKAMENGYRDKDVAAMFSVVNQGERGEHT